MIDELWQRAENYINKNVEGVDFMTGKPIKGKCFGVDNQSVPSGKRGVFLVVSGEDKQTYKIDFETFKEGG